MSLRCLVVADDLESLDLICRALEEAHIQKEICTEAEQGQTLLRTRKFEAVIVDCDDLTGGLELLRSLRHIAFNRFAVVFALVNGKTRVSAAFDAGANFVMDKPLIPDLLARSLKAAQGFMLREQRRSYRCSLDALVTLTPAKGGERHFNARNLSEGGICIEGVKGVKVGDTVGIHFQIADIQLKVESQANIVWINDQGRAGLKFTKMAAHATEVRLKDWLAKQFENEAPLLFINASRRTP